MSDIRWHQNIGAIPFYLPNHELKQSLSLYKLTQASSTDKVHGAHLPHTTTVSTGFSEALTHMHPRCLFLEFSNHQQTFFMANECVCLRVQEGHVIFMG